MSVDDRNADTLEMPQPVQRVERRLTVAAQIRRRARTIEHERIRCVVFRWIEDVRGRVESRVRQTAPLQLGEERLEPVGMFVVDRDGLHWSAIRIEGRRGRLESFLSVHRIGAVLPAKTKTLRSG